MFFRNILVHRHKLFSNYKTSCFHHPKKQSNAIGNTISYSYPSNNILNAYSLQSRNSFLRSDDNNSYLKKKFYYLDPKQVYYTQPNVSFRFHDGREVTDLINQLSNKVIAPEAIPKIRVTEYQGKYYSLDNRRLCAFKSAGLKKMPVEIVSLKDEEIAKHFKERFDPIHGLGKYVIICSKKQRSDALSYMKKHGVIKGNGCVSANLELSDNSFCQADLFSAEENFLSNNKTSKKSI